MVDRWRLNRDLAAAVGGPDAALAVCRACVAWLPMTGAAITVMDGAQGHEAVCATDDGAARIDELQFTLGDGPCAEAFTSGRAVLVADIADPDEGRWPVFAAAATETGARGMFVFPLHVGATGVGVLDCYRDTPGSLDDAELSGALHVADAALWALLDHLDPRTIDPENPGVSWLDDSALARAEVHQATGMLIAQAGLSAPAALAALRAAAFTRNRAITEVADEVVDRRLRLDDTGAWRTVRGREGPDGGTTTDETTDDTGTDDPGTDRGDDEDPS